MTALVIWTAVVAYVAVGVYLWPRFALESFKREQARYRLHDANKFDCGAIAVIHAAGWPIMLIVRLMIRTLTRRIEQEKTDEQRKEDAEYTLQQEAALRKWLPKIDQLTFDRYMVTTAAEALEHNRNVQKLTREMLDDGFDLSKALEIQNAVRTQISPQALTRGQVPAAGRVAVKPMTARPKPPRR